MTEIKDVPALVYKNLKSILYQAFYMTHTFDFEVSLHYWMLWPMVWHGASAAGSVKFSFKPRLSRVACALFVRAIS